MNSQLWSTWEKLGDVSTNSNPKAAGEPQAGKSVHSLLWACKVYDAWGQHPLDHQIHLLHCLSSYQLAHTEMICHGPGTVWGCKLPYSDGQSHPYGTTNWGDCPRPSTLGGPRGARWSGRGPSCGAHLELAPQPQAAEEAWSSPPSSFVGVPQPCAVLRTHTG